MCRPLAIYSPHGVVRDLGLREVVDLSEVPQREWQDQDLCQPVCPKPLVFHHTQWLFADTELGLRSPLAGLHPGAHCGGGTLAGWFRVFAPQPAPGVPWELSQNAVLTVDLPRTV